MSIDGAVSFGVVLNDRRTVGLRVPARSSPPTRRPRSPTRMDRELTRSIRSSRENRTFSGSTDTLDFAERAH